MMKLYWLKRFWRHTKCKFYIHGWKTFSTDRDYGFLRRHCPHCEREQWRSRHWDGDLWVTSVLKFYKPSETEIAKKVLESYE
jgi:hypothetical protein